MSDYPRNIRIMVEVPWHGELLRQTIAIAPEEADRSFEPLPRDWDANPDARLEAYDQKRLRAHIVNVIGRQLADGILKQIESRDSHHGYSPEEWNAINSPNPPTP